MPRKTTPSFVVTLPLRVSPGDERRLRDRFVCGTRLANVMIQHARALVASMRSSAQWAAARALPRTTEDQRRARAEAFGGIRKFYGFTKVDFDAVVCQHAKAAGFYGRIGTHEMQALAERVFRGADEWVCGKRGALRFKGRNRPLHSLSGKNNKTCLSWKPDSYELQIEAGFRLQAILPDLKRDEWLASALMAPTKYCRLLWRNVRGQRQWSVQLIQQGLSPLKASVLERLAAEGTTGGLDIGPSTLAWCTNTDAGVFRFCAEVDRPHALIRRLQRHLDRQRRANNPANFHPDGRCKKGAHRWASSRRQRRTEASLAEVQRHEAAVRAHAQGRDTNLLLSKARSWKDDGVSPKALQKRYGRSISVRAPGAFMNTLTRKAERAGGGRHIIEVRALKTSQYDHTTHDFVKKPLSQRWHVFRDGRGRVQRDVYSAFLALHAQGNTHNPSGLDLAWGELASSLLRAGLCALKPQAVPSGTHAGSSPDVGVVRSKFLKPRSEQLTPSAAPRGLSGTPGL